VVERKCKIYGFILHEDNVMGATIKLQVPKTPLLMKNVEVIAVTLCKIKENKEDRPARGYFTQFKVQI
jgi:hypothetical protein